MSAEKYFHVRINFSEPNLFDADQFDMKNSFENYRSRCYKNTHSVPYDFIENPSILNLEDGFLKFLDKIVETENLINFNDAELRKNVFKTINYNCYFLNARYWENIFEEIRIQEYNHLPSRKKCIYICKGISQLNFWVKKLTSQSQASDYKIYELEIDEQKVFECDAKILELGIMPDENIKEKAHCYWSSHHTKNPELECLYFGSVKIKQEYKNLDEITANNSLGQAG